MTIADRLTEIEVLDLEGRPFRLGDAWRDRPVALLFIRHFGWLFCREQVTQVRDEALDRIREMGAELVVVGNGRPEHARDFQQQHGLDVPLYVDPDLRAYAAAGLRRDLRSTLNLSTVTNAVRALRGGHRQSATQGDPWQQGGAFVITSDGEVAYEYVSRAAGDHPDPQAIVAALANVKK